MGSLINLIEAVKNHPKLFQNSLPNEDHDILNEWSCVAEECKFSRSDAQDQWNILLMEYVEYLRSNQDFPLAKHMDFLQPHFFTVIDNENIDEDELLNAIDPKSEEVIKTHCEPNKSLKPIENLPEVQKIIKAERHTKPTTTEEPSFTPILQPTQPLPEPSPVNNIVVEQSNHSFINLSSLELIFLGYAKQLQKMPLPLQLKTKRKIANLMNDAELEMMNN